MRALAAILVSGALTVLPGCFTGVESTPKITGKEIKKHPGPAVSAEAALLADIRTDESPTPGARLYVTSERLGLVLVKPDGTPAGDVKAGEILTVDSLGRMTEITGDSVVYYAMHGRDGETLEYRPGVPAHRLEQVRTITIPFTINLDALSEVRNRLTGKDVYFLPARRLTEDGRDTLGLRYQRVTITDVRPGTESLPLTVFFRTPEGVTQSVAMTMGQRSTARRNFETLFALTDPRTQHTEISDELWDLIIHSRVRLGMTPAQCRLALGDPDSYRRLPTTMGYVEIWEYTNGVYLYFQDGMLERFRQ